MPKPYFAIVAADTLGPHAQLEHLLREITDEAEPAVSRASIVLEMHAQFAEARDAMKAKWAEL